MQGADLVAVEIAQISEIDFAGGTFAHAGRLFASRPAIGDTGGMPRIGLLGRIAGKADGAAIGVGRGFAIDRLRASEQFRSLLAAARLRHVASTKWERRRYLSMDAPPNPAKQEAAA